MSSLVNLILGQTAIILTLGIALLLLFAAIVLTVAFRIRNRPARPARPKRAVDLDDDLDNLPIAAAGAEAKPVPPQAIAGQSATPGQPEPTSPNTTPGAAAKPPVQPGAPQVAGATAAAPAATAGTPATPASAAAPQGQADAVSSAMQDLLSTVFVDEASAARLQTLLKGREHINISDLAARCKQIAGQLQIRTQATATGVKEASHANKTN